MTDDRTPVTDEELSAAIDGEADPEVIARIDRDPEARARFEELRAAADRVAGLPPVALPDDAVDRLVAGALDVPVAPPAPARGTPRTTWLVAAGVVLLVGLGLVLVFTGRGGDEDLASSGSDGSFDTVGSAIDEDGAGADAAPEASAEADASSGQAATTTAPSDEASDAGVVDLGAYASGEELRAALATSFPATATANRVEGARAAASTAAIDRCAEQLQVTLGLDDGPLQVGVATVDDDDVLVYEFATTATDDGSPTTLVAAVGTDACDPIELFER